MALVLTGCGSGDPKPKVLPPASVGASPSAGAVAVPVPLPPAANAETAEGASAFARHYMDVLTASLQSADPQPVIALSDAGCQGCQNIIGAIRQEAAMGQRVVGAPFRVIFAEAPPVRNGEVILNLRYERLRGELLDVASGRVLQVIEPEPPLDAQMRLRKSSSGWTVLGLRSVQGG